MDKDNTKELTREQRLEVEEKALQALISMGVRFSVPLKLKVKDTPKWVTWWNKHFPKRPKLWRDKRIPKDWEVTVEELPDANAMRLTKTYVRHFKITPLYLGTIDAMRRLYIQMEYDVEALDKDPIEESKEYYKYIPLLAEIAAIACVNASSVAELGNPEIKTLKQFFIEHLTVTRLQKLCDTISQMMNPAGFTYSIRSIREVGMTKPQPKATEIE